MNLLQGLGGVGAGLITANQLLRQQKNDEQMAKLREAQIGLADASLAKATREIEDGDALRSEYQRLTQQVNGTDADTISAKLNREEGFTDADMKESGIPTGGNRITQREAFKQLADTAIARGDHESAKKYMAYDAHLKQQHDEGMTDLARQVYAGNVDPVAAEQAFNATGKWRVKQGSAKWDASTNTLSGLDENGNQVSMDKDAAHRYLVMSGAIKNPKYKSAGDGQVFNEDTGEVKGSPRSAHKPIVVNGAIFEQQDDGKGGVIYKKVAEAPKQASVVVHQGTGGAGLGNTRGGGLKVQKTVETSEGIVAVMSDGSHKILTGGDGNPLRGTSGLKVAAGLVGKTLNQYGENGDVAGKVTDLARKLDGSGSTKTSINDATRYLNAATTQEDYNKRTRELKAKGWTNEQIKAAAK